jgi:N6-adenosine-specific RNA methylase IME4
MKFQIIVADPAWNFLDSLKMSDVKRGAKSNYNVMTDEQIMNLSINDLAAPEGALLALWVPSSLLQSGLNVMNKWGFEHRQTYVWIKTKKESLSILKKQFITLKRHIISDKHGTEDLSDHDLELIMNSINTFNCKDLLFFGLGRLFRNTHELCLIGINNNKIYKYLKNKSQRTVCFATNLKHSQKPEDLQDSLDMMFPDESIKKIELFARRQRPGWHCIGNECPGSIGIDILDSINDLKSK